MAERGEEINKRPKGMRKRSICKNKLLSCDPKFWKTLENEIFAKKRYGECSTRNYS